jgi:hypothetical protein
MNLSKQAKSVQQMLILALLVVVFMFLSGCGEKVQKKVYKVGILCGLDYIGAIPDIFKPEMASWDT